MFGGRMIKTSKIFQVKKNPYSHEELSLEGTLLKMFEEYGNKIQLDKKFNVGRISEGMYFVKRELLSGSNSFIPYSEVDLVDDEEGRITVSMTKFVKWMYYGLLGFNILLVSLTFINFGTELYSFEMTLLQIVIGLSLVLLVHIMFWFETKKVLTFLKTGDYLEIKEKT